MRGIAWMTAAALVVGLLPTVPAAEAPHRVAEAALAAWKARDAARWEQIIHPELLLRCRTADIIDRHQQANAPERDPLKAIAEGRREHIPEKDLRNATTREVLERLFEAMNSLLPHNPRVYSVDRIFQSEMIVVGELAIVSVETTTRLRGDPSWNRTSRADLLLKKNDGEWRFLWSPEMQSHVDPKWNARRELVADITLLSDRRTSVSITGLRGPRQFSEAAIALPPGDYEVVGTRTGYQTVTWLMHVSPDLYPVQVSVVCIAKQE